MSVSPLRDSGGRLLGSVHVAHDVTEKKRAENALRDSQTRYRLLVETAQEGIGIVDPDENIVFVNQAYADMLGHMKEELLGLNLRELTDEAEFAKYREGTRQRRQGKSSRYETVLRHKTSGSRHFSLSASPLFDDRGDFLGTVGLLTDITESKLAEQALRESQQRFKTLADMLPQTVYECDADGKLTYVNRRALEAFGYTAEDFDKGVYAVDMLAPEDRTRGAQTIAEVMAGRIEPKGREYLARRKDGSTLPVIIYSSPIIRGKQTSGLRGIIVDITERKQAEEALRRSEHRFRETLENLGLVAAQIDAEGRVTFCNKYLAELTGWGRDDLLGRDWIETLVPLHRRARMRRDFLGAAKAGRKIPAQYENPILTRTGAQRLVAWSNTVMRDEDGRAVGLTAIGEDVTDRKRAEEALRESEQKYRALVEGSLQGIVVLQDLRIVFANRAAAEIAGLTVEQALAMSPQQVQAFIPPEDRARVLQHLDDRLAGKPVPARSEYRLLRGDGGELWIEVFVSVIQYRGRPAIHVSVVDITERKRAEEALRRSEKLQAEAERIVATGRMAARVAHEINNPLAGIKNSFRLIRHAVPEDHPDHDMVGRIEREIDRIAHVVRQMYKLHSPRARTPTDVPVEETIRDVLLMLEPLRREHEVRVELAPVSAKLIVKVPEGSLQQVLYNLTANAIQASPRNGAINIAAEPTDKDYIRISVRDQGPGIPAEVRDRMFEPFFSADTGAGSKEGIGLGLSIVRSIVESVRGRIEVETRVGEGACFHVCLPASQP
jgi:PAS domain S-box-containing protein